MSDEAENPLAHLRLAVDNPEPAPPPVERSRETGHEGAVERPAGAAGEPNDLRAKRAGETGHKGSAERRDGGGGGRPPKVAGGWGDKLPPDCPVQVLGKQEGTLWLIDSLRQLRALAAERLTDNLIIDVFGDRLGWVYEHFPRYDKDGNPSNNWVGKHVREALMAEANRRGIFNPDRDVRGPGGWATEAGALVLHAGDGIAIGRKPPPDSGEAPPDWPAPEFVKPGRYGGLIYPADSARPRPWDSPVTAEECARPLFDLLATFAWKRPELDPWFMLGHMVTSMIGAGVDWRPVLWLTGAQATGKSTLQQINREVQGGALFAYENTTAAGIYQPMRYSSLPVTVDELESDMEPKRVQAIVELSRIAAGGGTLGRGGSSAKDASQFTARGTFLFDAIEPPGLKPQDMSRMVMLELLRLGQREPLLPDPEGWRIWGRKLRRRIWDGWWRWPATLAAYRAELRASGHIARGANVFGTLLAAADLVSFDAPPDGDTLAGWGAKLDASSLAELVGQEAPDVKCLRHLLTSRIEHFYRHGRAPTVAELIEEAAAGANLDSEDADGALRAHGLRVYDYRGERWLAVANDHQGLARLFANSQWHARSGAVAGWVRTLSRLPGAAGHAAVRYAGIGIRSQLLPLALVQPEDQPENEAAPEPGAGLE